jgi:hypothetical protein
MVEWTLDVCVRSNIWSRIKLQNSHRCWPTNIIKLQNPRYTGPLGGIEIKEPQQDSQEVGILVIIVAGRSCPFNLGSIGGKSVLPSTVVRFNMSGNDDSKRGRGR